MTPEHTTAINSQCWTGSEGRHHYVFREVRNLLNEYLLRNSMRSSTLVLMYIKPRHMICNGDFSLLRIKSWDITPWGLVDRPNSLEESAALVFRVWEFFPSNHEDGNARFHQLLLPKCQTPPHHIPWTHNLNIIYTKNTDFTCIFLAFRVVQHDSSSWNRPIVKLSHARKLTFL